MQFKGEALMPVPIFKNMERVIRKYNQPGIEIEVRLGKRTTKMFDANIGRAAFTRIVRGLEKYQGWESKTKSDESVYYKDGPDGYRVIINNDTDEIVHQTKRKVEMIDVQLDGKPFDIRLAVSSEIPCEDKELEMDREVRRIRKSFLRKGVRIDCTERTGPPKDRDSENLTEYQIEVELVKIPETEHELYNSLHKVFNVIEL